MSINYFSVKNLEKEYEELKKGKLNTGISKVSRKSFERDKPFHIKIISEKALSKTYHFTPYKEILIIKDKNSKPRVLSIPTIKDKLTLSILKQVIDKSFHLKGKKQTVEDIVLAVSHIIKSNKYDYYYKLDLSNYFGSINHRILNKKLSSAIHDTIIIKLIKDAITTPTVNADLRRKDRPEAINKKGVPQGLSISNSLAFIYLLDIDNKYKRFKKFTYFRYVDDILILCNQSDYDGIKNSLESELKNIAKLKINQSKRKADYISNSFDFLGYTFLPDGNISVREKNRLKVERSLEEIFNDFKNARDRHIKGNYELLKWKIDLRITGCMMKKKQYGWVKFYRLSTIEKDFYKLDAVIRNLIKRYGLEKKLIKGNKYIGKKFSKAYYEISKNNETTKYVPNFNDYTIEQKKNLLTEVCRRKTDKWTDSMIEYEFDKFIFKSISGLEQDLQQIYM